MTSPYSTPRYPGAPNPTPRSNQKSLRAPIHNPFDKFTQPEFDAWISDITGALKRALGQEEAPPPAARAISTVQAEDETVLEDSFAEVKARRLAKGKERAREEDLDVAQRHEEGQLEDEEEEGWGEPYDGEEYSSEEEESKEGSPEVIELLSDDEEAQRSEQEAEEDEDAEAEDDYDEEAEGSEAGSDEDEESEASGPTAAPSIVAHSNPHEVTEILDSDEDQEEDGEGEDTDDRRALPARFQRKPDIVADARMESDEGEPSEDELDEEQAEEEEEPFPPRAERKEPVDIDDPWRGPATYAEDFYSGGDLPASSAKHGDPHVLPNEGDDQQGDENEQAVHSTEARVQEDDDDLIPEEPEKTPDLPDPWEGPRTFAEDFYAGGDALPEHSEGITPSHLTPKDEGPLFIPGITDHAKPSHATKEDGGPSYATSPDESYNAGDSSSDPLVNGAHEGEAARTLYQPVAASSAQRMPPSPPPATLRSHVDWNWPPAFPGRVATGPGHVESSEHEIFEISDDDDVDEEPDLAPQPAREQMAQPTVPEATTMSTALQQQEPVQTELPDSSDLYADFSDLYDMDMGEPSYNAQPSFEPISPPGLDFGDLPPTTATSAPAEDNLDVQALDVDEASAFLTSLGAEDAPTSALRDSPERDGQPTEGSAVGSEVREASPAVVAETRRFSVGLEEVTDEDDPTYHPSKAHGVQPRKRRPSVSVEEVTDEDDPDYQRSRRTASRPQASEREVVVIEADDEEDGVEPSAQPGDDIDISSVRGDVETSEVEYIVEEAVTEGRRTADPESPSMPEETYAPSIRTVSPEVQPSVDAPQVEEPEEPDDAAANDASAPQPTHDASHPAAPTALERTLSASNIPPPVSANPNVPDPASIPPSPASPDVPSKSSSPDAEARDATALPANATQHPLFRKLASTAHTPSGLFTPLTTGDSASVTPDREVAEDLGPSEPEQPGAQADEDKDAEAAVDTKPSVVDAVDGPEEEAEAAPEVDELLDDEPAVAEGPADIPPAGATDAPDSALNSAVVARDFTEDQRLATPATDADDDADGEVDLEYAPTAQAVEEEDPSLEGLQTVVEPAEGEPSKVDIDETTQSAEAEQAAEAHAPVEPEVSEVREEAIDAAEAQEAEKPTAAEEDAVAEGTAQVEQGVGPEDVVDAPTPLATAADDREPTPKPSTPDDRDATPVREVAASSSPTEEPAVREEAVEGRTRKRKRASPSTAIARPLRVTRSRTSQSTQNAVEGHVEKEKPAPKPKRAKAKGKQRAQAETDEEDNVSVAPSHASESTSGGSSTAAQKMLIPDSRGTSRASSVASNAPSTYSGLSQLSPTIDRVLPSNGHHAPPPPFIHNNGILHHHHGRPTAHAVPVAPKRQPSAAPEPPLLPSEPPRLASAEPGPSSQPAPSRAPAVGSTSSTSSPVTRSNCRFHTISIPKGENGPRIHFAVPGCSLGNAELLKDENIEDQGFVKASDIPRLIREVESLNLSPYLLGVLRQLVGVDLLREQEVFYIPRPGDGVVMKSRRKARPAKLKQMESISARTLSNGGASRAMAPPSQASVSTSGDSASVAGRLSQRGSVATTASLSGSELSDLEPDEAPPTKRVKAAHEETHEEVEAEAQQAGEPAVASSPPVEQGTADAVSNAPKPARLQARRSKRLGVDAAAYKPEGGTSDGSGGEEEQDTKKRRKRGSKRGLKRARTEVHEETAAEGSSAKTKRRRVRASVSTGDNPTVAATEGDVASAAKNGGSH
ncbi:hypothetical protein FKP32DRAFT_1685428 [Trametes sanguinea]|nr:hypothetical protein FKP32DRAFT_1685428 [Trametes sanguinea]